MSMLRYLLEVCTCIVYCIPNFSTEGEINSAVQLQKGLVDCQLAKGNLGVDRHRK